ncbi:MAG: UvrD-helicase domain-containing protein, partial [Candidatus Woesearchaeota archaeon]
MEHLEGLNSSQKEAAIHKNGPLLIIAGAGAGKTKTITHRIVNLIKEGVSPDKILAVTFTNKAAKEMKERVFAEMQKNAKGQNTNPFISTFHSLGVHIIKENAQILGLTKNFTILDDHDSTFLIKETIKELGLDPKQYDPRKIKNAISREKGKFTDLNIYAENRSDYLGKIIAQVWGIYENKKSKENSLDFDDLLLKSTKLLKDNKEIREMYQNKWEYIHIDEYQDTNEVQYLISHLLSEKNKNICVVGDADQNIYSWRGANLKNILNFEKDYPNTKIITLEENYRSTKNILSAA